MARQRNQKYKIQQQQQQQSCDSDGENKNEIKKNKEEISFYKMIWGNLYLKTLILSFVNNDNKGFKLGVYKYERIVSVQWLLKHGYIELLKYKVKRGEHLIDWFEISANTDNQELNFDYNTNRLSVLNEVRNDLEFYQNLFKNYSRYFVFKKDILEMYDYQMTKHHAESVNKTNEPYDLLEYSTLLTIKYDNVQALSMLHKEYNANLTIHMFYDALNIGSINAAKYIFRALKVNKNDIIGKAWLNSTFIKASVGEESPKDFNIINSVVKFLILDIKLIPPKEINKVREDIFQVDIKSLTVNQLYQCCYTISLLLEKTNLFKEYLKCIAKKEIRDKYMGYKGKLQNYLPDPLIDFMSNTRLTELKPSLDTIGNSQVYLIPNSNTLVFNLFKMLLTFTNYSSSYKENFNFFNCKYYNDYPMLDNTNIFLPIEFGSFKDVQTLKEQDHSYRIKPPTLFKYCSNDLELQLEFIKQATENIKGEDFKIKPTNLILLLLFINRLDLIKLVITNLKDIIQSSQLIPFDLFQHIKSTEVFDYFIQFTHIGTPLMVQSLAFEICLKSEGYNLMNHLKNNHKEFYSNLKTSIYSSDDNNFDYSKESLLFIYNNMNDFKECYGKIDIWKRNYYFRSNFTLNEYIQLVKGTPFNQQYNYNCGNRININYSDEKKLILNIIHWVHVNRPQDIESKRCNIEYGGLDQNIKIDEHQILISMYYYYCGNYSPNKDLPQFSSLCYKSPSYQTNFLSNNNYNDKLSLVRYLIGSNGDIGLLDKFMKIIKGFVITDPNKYYLIYSNFLDPLSIIATIYGQINILHYFKSNYPWVFNPNLGLNNQDLFFYRNQYTKKIIALMRNTAKAYNNIDVLIEFNHNN